MNSLPTSANLARTLPDVVDSIQKASRLFGQIRNFEDIERLFLKGSGLSTNTYRSYLEAVRQFYQFTKGLNPLQVRPCDIESFYDHLLTRVDLNTAYLRIRGLKKFFKGVQTVVPFYTSPFEIMGEKLHAKLNRTSSRSRTKKALTSEELKILLAFLTRDTSQLGQENYALIYMLATSGLRASELCGLKWGDLECSGGQWIAYFVGKGGKAAAQELFAPAVLMARRHFEVQFGMAPLNDDAIFWTEPSFAHQSAKPLAPHTLWARIRRIGVQVSAAGVLSRDFQFSPHLFRRTYATLLYRSGMKLKAIQGLTRHSDIQTLCRHYVDDQESATPYLATALSYRH